MSACVHLSVFKAELSGTIVFCVHSLLISIFHQDAFLRSLQKPVLEKIYDVLQYSWQRSISVFSKFAKLYDSDQSFVS